MAGETPITVIGNLTDDPELKFTPSGAAVANFTVASTPRRYDKNTNEWVDGDPLFFRCAAWRQMAEHVAESLQKGTRVLLQGTLKIRNYERQDGSRGTSVEIDVEEIGPSLKFATAKVDKARRSSSAASAGAGRSAAANPWGDTSSNPWGSGGQSTDEPPF